MSEVKVNKLSPRSGTTVTIGDSGDTTNIVGTLQNNGAVLTGDISSVVAGTGLSGGGTSGDVTINIEAAQPTITSLGTITSFRSTGIDDNADALAMTIDSSENIGIGTATPDGKVDIAAPQTTSNKFTSPNLALTATSQSNSDGFTGISYAAATITNYGWTVGSTRSSGGDGSSHFTFRNHYNSASGTEKVRIDSGGRLIVGATSSSTIFHVEGDATVTGGIRLGGTGTANELDDYEEGTWTPVLTTSGTNYSSVGYSIQYGHYVKVGQMVTVQCRVQTNSFTQGSPSGNIRISGLPFTSATNNIFDYAGSLAFASKVDFNLSSFGTLSAGAAVPRGTALIGLLRTRNNNTADGVPATAITASGFDISITNSYIV